MCVLPAKLESVWIVLILGDSGWILFGSNFPLPEALFIHRLPNIVLLT